MCWEEEDHKIVVGESACENKDLFNARGLIGAPTFKVTRLGPDPDGKELNIPRRRNTYAKKIYLRLLQKNIMG